MYRASVSVKLNIRYPLLVSSTYVGELTRGGEGKEVTPVATEKTLDMELLKRRDPILFYKEVTLYVSRRGLGNCRGRARFLNSLHSQLSYAPWHFDPLRWDSTGR